MAPLRHGLDTKATVFTWSITTDIRANLLSARFSKRAPAATRILFSACCRDHDDTGVTELTDRICRVRRPVDNPCTASTGRRILIAWMGSAGVNSRIGRDKGRADGVERVDARADWDADHRNERRPARQRIAVGMLITGRSPHRTGRVAFPYPAATWMFDGEAVVGPQVRMRGFGSHWSTSLLIRSHPSCAVLLAALRQHAHPKD